METGYYPIIYISSLDDTIIAYDAIRLEVSPMFFPGMEVRAKDGRWEVDRVFVSDVGPGRPSIYVLLIPPVKPTFVKQKHKDFCTKVFNEWEKQIKNQLLANEIGDSMVKDLEAFGNN